MRDPTSEFPPADPMPPDIAALRGSTEPVWIFAYGSLMWDEDFLRAETETALLRGYHRSFCLYSYDYRGTRCVCRPPGSARRSIACGRAR